MKLPTSTQFILAAALAAVATQASVVDKGAYMKDIAPQQLQRLHDYRAENAASLTEAQGEALDLMEKVVTNFATDVLDAAESACAAAFGRDECMTTLSGFERAEPLRPRGLACQCATLSPYCTCTLRAQHCEYYDGKLFSPGVIAA